MNTTRVVVPYVDLHPETNSRLARLAPTAIAVRIDPADTEAYWRLLVDEWNRPGDLVVIDFGALVDGYCSDMTRTIAIGQPTATQSRMLEVVLAAQAAGVAAVGAGVPAKDVDAACREVIAEAGWADAFTHGTGHGVGLDIHEAPRVGTTSDATLAVGDVVTVEPGVYLPAHGGVRVEDTVVVTPEGCRPLTHSTKDPAP